MRETDEGKRLLINKKRQDDHHERHQRPPSRLEWAEASWTRIFYVVTLLWINPALLSSYNQTLTHTDLEDLPHNDKSSSLLHKMYAYNLRTIGTWKILIQLFGKESFTLIFFSAFRLACRIGKILFLRAIVLFLDEHQTLPSALTRAYVYAVALFVCTLLEVCTHRWLTFQLDRIGLQIRNTLILAIYKHSLSLTTTSLLKITTAKAVNLIAHDTEKYESLHLFIQYLWLAPLEAIVVFGFLCWIIGPLPASMGYAVLILLLLGQIVFNRQFHHFCSLVITFTDQRIHRFCELINGCQIIKMYNWQKPIEKLLLESRQQEFRNIQRASHLRALTFSIFCVSIPLMALTTFGTMWLTGQPLYAANVFATLAFYNLLRLTILRCTPIAMEKLSEAFIASKRINDFMQLPIVQEPPTLNSYQSSCDEQLKGKISMQDASFSWHDTHICLSQLNFTIHPGTFVGIVGQVGSGKSSLLTAILGEMNLITGHIDIHDSSFSYAAQIPWILPDTIRANILLGNSFDEQRYSSILHACCLDVDISVIGISGDLTMIGEKGVNLSGGQKARLSLARALYAKADIYLLDDPLSAVDHRVAQQIYDRCIGPQGLLSKKTRLLVTHHTQFLHDTDQVILFEHGQIQAQGPIHDLSIQVEKIESTSDIETESEAISSLILDIKQSTTDTQSIIVDETLINDSHKHSIVISLFTTSCLGWFGFVLLIFLLVTGEVCYNGTIYWLSVWSRQASTEQQHRSINLYIYLSLTMATLMFAFMRAHYFFYLILKGANRLHNTMLNRLLYTSLRFYESNPTGRILNRASKDQKVIDEVLPAALFDAWQLGLMSLSPIFIFCLSNPLLLLLLIPLGSICLPFIHVYLRCSRQFQILENASRSVVYTTYITSLNGLATIRALQMKDTFLQLFVDHLDTHSCSRLMLIGSSSWLGFWLDIISSLFSLFAALSVVLFRHRIDPSAAALSLTYSINMVIYFQWTVRQFIECEILMKSAQRIDEYGRLPPEEDIGDGKRLIQTPPDWPKDGVIEFRDYSLCYRAGLEPALKCINLHIASNEKLGIIGRTGTS